MKPRSITRATLRRMPLPTVDGSADKDARGRVLAIGGGVSLPGAILLSGVGALRAGAGKLQLATVASITAALGVAVPEALVIGLPATRTGDIAGEGAASLLRDHAARAGAVLIGPGINSDRSAHALIARLVRALSDDATLVLDAAGILALTHDESLLHRLDGRAILTPHAGEMASLMGMEKEEVEANARAVAIAAAERFGAVVALKGAESWIAHPDGRLLHYAGGGVGLATSGSGDTLAGIVTGLAARGAAPVTAAAWGVYLHGAAGRLLARRMGRLGFLARELLAEIPGIMRALE